MNPYTCIDVKEKVVQTITRLTFGPSLDSLKCLNLFRDA